VFWIIIAAAIVLDIISKQIVIGSMTENQVISVIPGLFDLRYINNHGAAFSILQGKTLLLIIATCAMMAGLVVYYVLKRKSIIRAEQIALAMIVGGGVGNLIDRIFQGYVTDFLDIHIIPIFNVADCFITVGCALLVISVLFIEPRTNKANSAEDR